MTTQFADAEFQFGLEIALGAAYRQASDVGEALATAGRIADGDADSWVNEWTATAEVCQAAGAEAESAGRRVSALSYYRRAATYYATALYRFSGATDHSPERELELWRRQRACWERSSISRPVPGERISIPYEDTTLEGFFFRAPDAAPGERRPLVVMNNGSDGATSAMWLEGGAAAAERGYHWMTFDGPGQQAALYEQNIPFRHDWEAVLTPVLDAILPRPDVDEDHVALIGVSQAGYWVPRAIAFEHRFAAAVADGGIVDISAGWIKQLPEMMRKQLSDGERDAFDREMQVAESQVAGGQGDARLPRQALWVQRWLALRPLPGGRVLPARRRGEQHHHAAADHRPRRRAVLPRTAPTALRPRSRHQRARPVHRARRRQRPLRADGPVTARHPHLRLARGLSTMSTTTPSLHVRRRQVLQNKICSKPLATRSGRSRRV